MPLRDLVPRRKGAVPTRVRPPETLFDALQSEVDRVFEDFWRGWPTSLISRERPLFRELEPCVDVTETEKEFRVTAELPGIELGDIELSVRDGMLVIQGEKRTEEKEERENYFYRERSYGSFSRAIPFPVEIEEDHVEARAKNGVLTVVVPKREPGKPARRRIEVKSD